MSDDKDLGMNCPISRRDFLNGVALSIGNVLIPPSALAFGEPGYAPEKVSGYYPPALTGMRGNHDGTFTYAHKLRDGESWTELGKAEVTGESYDLVVVGAGISGLAAAYFYRKMARNNGRILILDNHDDFGGHAKRNEFRVGDRTLITHGGTMSIEHPAEYSKEAMGLLVELGIDVQRFYKAYDQKLYRQLGTAMFYDRATFGVDRIVPGMGKTPWHEFLANSPLPQSARVEIARVYTEKEGLPRWTEPRAENRAPHQDQLRRLSNSDLQTHS